MAKFGRQQVLRAGLLATSMLIAPQIVGANNVIDGNNGTLPTPPGLYVTPVAPLTNALQQALNPRLPAYPNFVAGEAVKVVPSPDGATLAILTAGQNSLYGAAGSVDYANSTQYIFIYNVAGANKTSPVLTQVLKQNNSHVGLVWAPNGNTLYAAGGNDDCVYVYNKTGSTFTPGIRITLGHVSASSTGSLTSPPVRSEVSASTRRPAAAFSRTRLAWPFRPTARRWSLPTTTTTRLA